MPLNPLTHSIGSINTPPFDLTPPTATVNEFPVPLTDNPISVRLDGFNPAVDYTTFDITQPLVV